VANLKQGKCCGFGSSFAVFEIYMVKAENNHDLRQFSSDIGRPSMTILSAALVPEEVDPSATKLVPPPRTIMASIYATLIRPLRHLVFGRKGLKR
jgi:hypothetical protein